MYNAFMGGIFLSHLIHKHQKPKPAFWGCWGWLFAFSFFFFAHTRMSIDMERRFFLRPYEAHIWEWEWGKGNGWMDGWGESSNGKGRDKKKVYHSWLGSWLGKWTCRLHT
ncbi:hypothetical protein B0T21DRAFT_368623 [Apiosordaria backusii]|uniref:Uncharacterized protein n=1 Tax=Apiosordaria backusii TaxID=314023 RepID=A0AA40BKD3_9PEZI|nr:hypothetical protein B0T21DRAFT_368623 [Apiosordaria backusii]